MEISRPSFTAMGKNELGLRSIGTETERADTKDQVRSLLAQGSVAVARIPGKGDDPERAGLGALGSDSGEGGEGLRVLGDVLELLPNTLRNALRPGVDLDRLH